MAMLFWALVTRVPMLGIELYKVVISTIHPLPESQAPEGHSLVQLRVPAVCNALVPPS